MVSSKVKQQLQKPDVKKEEILKDEVVEEYSENIKELQICDTHVNKITTLLLETT